MSVAPPRTSLLLLAYLAFVSLGLPDGLLGVGWPSISAEFGVPTGAVGLVLTAGTIGYLTSSVLAGFTLARLGVGRLLAGSTLLASLALTGYASAPALTVLIGCALVLGLGSGAIDSGLNAYAAGAFGPRHMNWMHAFFGLGVAIGPLVMTAMLSTGAGWRWGYAVTAAAQLALATAFALTVGAWRDRPAGPPTPPHAAPVDRTVGARPDDTVVGPAGHPGPVDGPAVSGHGGSADDSTAAKRGGSAVPAGVRIGETLRLPAVWFGALAFAVYVAIEVSAGLYAFLLLTEGRGVPDAVAGLSVSGYWASLFVGRVVQGLVAERLGTARVLRGSLLGMAVGAALIALPAPGWVTVVGLIVLGFAAAPVFPLLTLSTAERVGREHADRVIGVQIGAAGIGAALIPAGLGVLLGDTSVRLLGPVLTALAVALLVAHAAAARRTAAPPTG
ncbi:sugar MFS transporter [Micromonospora sp. HUAS LYJ1]|uniref:MFS transporter n=1 Tax=Micromonospora sp. HUAS LYJ1 TaxID=3061626 RepID=UPI0026714C2D|nr:MFS transporter [Micromonospora sp. HUAS LYJ1]WKU05144.1 MFS transporter [Micromonospora sp. HUAS LYJ1]